jgi:putative chitinase
VAQLRQILPLAGALADTYAIHITNTANEFGIGGGTELAMFIAQVGHESGQLRRIEENLNYTNGDRLLAIFGSKRFKSAAEAATFAGQPQRIANRVYAGRNGNGDEASGEGWKYRGRGLIQITGRNNYAAASEALFEDTHVLLDNPDRVLDSEIATRTAGWYWMANRCGMPAARGDVQAVTKIINGPACDGLPLRADLFRTACRVLGC